MSMNEQRPHYRYSQEEKKHIKLWGNAVLVLLLVAVLGSIYAYLRYDGLGLNDVMSDQGQPSDTQNEPTTLVPDAELNDMTNNSSASEDEFGFGNDIQAQTGNIFDQLDNGLSSPSSTTGSSAAPAMGSLDASDPDNSSETGNDTADNTASGADIEPPPATAASANENSNNDNNDDNTDSNATVADNQNSEQDSPTPFVAEPTDGVENNANSRATGDPAAQEPQNTAENTPPAETAPNLSESSPTPPPAATRSEPEPRQLTEEDLGNVTQNAPAASSPQPGRAGRSGGDAVGPAFQVGSFSNSTNAESLRANLGFMGISSQVIQEDGMYKVITERSSGAKRQQIENTLKQQNIRYFPRF